MKATITTIETDKKIIEGTQDVIEDVLNTWDVEIVRKDDTTLLIEGDYSSDVVETMVEAINEKLNVCYHGDMEQFYYDFVKGEIVEG